MHYFVEIDELQVKLPETHWSEFWKSIEWNTSSGKELSRSTSINQIMSLLEITGLYSIWACQSILVPEVPLHDRWLQSALTVQKLARKCSNKSRRKVSLFVGALTQRLPDTPMSCVWGAVLLLQATDANMHHLSGPASIRGHIHTNAHVAIYIRVQIYKSLHVCWPVYMSLHTRRATQVVHISVRRLYGTLRKCVRSTSTLGHSCVVRECHTTPKGGRCAKEATNKHRKDTQNQNNQKARKQNKKHPPPKMTKNKPKT